MTLIKYYQTWLHFTILFQASPARNAFAATPIESAATSPVRLKRYEGFEHGLNIMGRNNKGVAYRVTSNEPSLRNKSPPLKKTKRKPEVDNLTLNFAPSPQTPNEKKSSTESNNERFIFLEKAFDKVFQLEDSENENNAAEKKSSFGSTRSQTVLTAIEPLSLPSVVGSKGNIGLFGTPTRTEHNTKTQGKINQTFSD